MGVGSDKLTDPSADFDGLGPFSYLRWIWAKIVGPFLVDQEVWTKNSYLNKENFISCISNLGPYPVNSPIWAKKLGPNQQDCILRSKHA